MDKKACIWWVIDSLHCLFSFQITCPICHDHFRDPKILPCLHYYCKQCVQALADRAGPNRPFSCPECRCDTRLPQNDPNQLATAFVINRLKDLHSLMETADRKVEAVCQQCSGGSSEGFCCHCAEFICGDCMKVHKKMKIFAGHEVLTLDELKEGGAKKIVAKPPPRMCQKHDEQKKIYCFDCDCLICHYCLPYEHNGHNHGFIKQAAPQCREALVQQMAPLKAAHKSYSDATDRAKAMISDIETQNTRNIGAVNQWIQEWTEIIQRYGHNLIDGMSGLAQGKIENLMAQLKSFQSDSAVIQSLGEFCEQNLENATDEEFIELHKQILSRVEDECRKHKDTNLELAEISDVGVELPSNQRFSDLCCNEAKVVVLNADPASCTVDLERAEINKNSYLTVCTLYRNGTPCKKPQAVEGELNSLVDGSLVRIKGTQKKEGVYEMVYTPRIRGRHQLAVTVNGEQVAGSPFTVCVKIPPTQLGTPVRVISGLNLPYGVAFNSAGEVLVTMSGGEVGVFDKQGKKLRTIKHTFKYPKGIAVDKEDNLFISDGGHHCVYKLDKDDNQLKVIGNLGSGNGEFNWPRGMAIIGEHVFVCDSVNHRIQVLSRELEFVKIIGSRGTGNGQFKRVYDISKDEAGNLYVCDGNNHRIQVLNSDGEFLYSFGIKGKGKGQLAKPAGVCVSDQFVYVSEYGNDRVSVFDRKGHFVTSFGSGGSAEGSFKWPYTLRVDKDGFVYVCEYSNNRVQVF